MEEVGKLLWRQQFYLSDDFITRVKAHITRLHTR
ncbi:hypothetical protein LTSEINV_4470, partial [Salmonella enterica subsp. enterica serovar Inverness str. R8-3668]